MAPDCPGSLLGVATSGAHTGFQVPRLTPEELMAHQVQAWSDPVNEAKYQQTYHHRARCRQCGVTAMTNPNTGTCWAAGCVWAYLLQKRKPPVRVDTNPGKLSAAKISFYKVRVPEPAHDRALTH